MHRHELHGNVTTTKNTLAICRRKYPELCCQPADDAAAFPPGIYGRQAPFAAERQARRQNSGSGNLRGQMLEQSGDSLGAGVDMTLKLLRIDIGRASGLGARQGGGEVRPRSCGSRRRNDAVL